MLISVPIRSPIHTAYFAWCRLTFGNYAAVSLKGWQEPAVLLLNELDGSIHVPEEVLQKNTWKESRRAYASSKIRAPAGTELKDGSNIAKEGLAYVFQLIDQESHLM